MPRFVLRAAGLALALAACTDASAHADCDRECLRKMLDRYLAP